MTRREYLINHYKQWIETTKNKRHKEYAQAMLLSVYAGNHQKTFKQIGNRSVPLRDDVRGITYPSIHEAAIAFGVSFAMMTHNYERYGLRKVLI